ncbi:hypothetical protein [Thalassolituus alkanivorans]|uniref:hypothetical protein n=1 Tax=Thalassolituus alkanivorans TaxID=2881055 RepID=UPI001E40E00F|nr:hypothetical protein [Thalassolituus alkanivorans]MCB2385191.1 hypothetical protein [Thalassolituus alkanivorans]MCB2421952.1 hypothetical protein [Thalassolituus alkanivorans]
MNSKAPEPQNHPQDQNGTDLRMLPPVSYITGFCNRVLGRIFMAMLNAPWASLITLLSLYLCALIIANIPALDIARENIFLVIISPLAIPVFLSLAYLCISLVLLALFARNPGTRVSCAVILEVLLIAPMLLMAVSDTRLFLMLGDTVLFVLLVGNMVAVPWLAFRYSKAVLHHAYLCLPLLVLLTLFIWFESTAGLSYEKISHEHISVIDCEWVRAKSKSGAPSGPPIKICDVLVAYRGSDHRFYGMPAPNGNINYMEVRQALFKHFRLQ